MILYIMGILLLVESYLILKSKNDVWVNLLITVKRKKGIKKVLHFYEDRTFKVEAKVPEADGNKIKINNTEHTIDKKTILFDRGQGVQTIAIRDHTNQSLDIYGDMDNTLTAAEIKELCWTWKQIGRLESENEIKTLKKIIIICAIAAAIAALFSFLNFQSMGALQEVMSTYGVSLG